MKTKKITPSTPIDLLLEDLDGCGLIITDTDLIKERMEEIGLSYDSKTIVTKK